MGYEYAKVLNISDVSICDGFLIKCFILVIRQGSEYTSISEYTRVGNILEFLNIPGLHKDLNEMFHDSILEYTLDSEYAKVLNTLGLLKDSE